MNTRKARKAIPHRLQDVITCLKWHRLVRLHLASNVLTELATVIELRTYNNAERALAKVLKSALLKKDRKVLENVLVSWAEVQNAKT
jgi:hypothetical protein